jgi:hypothetical protein
MNPIIGIDGAGTAGNTRIALRQIHVKLLVRCLYSKQYEIKMTNQLGIMLYISVDTTQATDTNRVKIICKWNSSYNL